MRSDSTAASDIIIHASELEERCEFAPAVSLFLTPAEQAELWGRVRYPHRLFFWGGFSGAERRCAVFLPEWATFGAPYDSGIRADMPEREDFIKSLIFGEDAPFEGISDTLSLMRIKGSGHRVLRHKDVLGSLMGLGITRQSVGDVCMISDTDAVFALSGKLTEYISDELKKVGSDGISLAPYDDPAEFSFERKFEEMTLSVASMRLDGIVSAVTGLSRTKSAEAVAAGLVRLSGITAENVAQEIREGDSVTVRGYGKFLISSTDGLTRKSRIRLCVKKYV